jgi:glutathione S-transferase
MSPVAQGGPFGQDLRVCRAIRRALLLKKEATEEVLQISGAGKVPVLIDGSLSVHEALAICEYVAERFPEARLWPEDQSIRARARAVSSEMSTGFVNVRNEMPMNHRGRARRFVPR